MKRFLLALAISFGLIVVYGVTASVIVLLASHNHDQLNAAAIYQVDIPLRLPKIVYFYFFPPSAQDYSTRLSSYTPQKAGLAIAFSVVNIFIYAIPVYVALTIISRLRKPASSSAQPPSPSEHFFDATADDQIETHNARK